MGGWVRGGGQVREGSGWQNSQKKSGGGVGRGGGQVGGGDVKEELKFL